MNSILFLLVLGLLSLTNVESRRQQRRQQSRQQQQAVAKVKDDFDPYEVLGIDDEATDRQIKKAFRKLSVKWHPDKNRGNEEAKLKFQEISKAYEILSDGDKKALFDAGGMELVEEGSREAPQDPFAAFFGGGRQQQGGKRRSSKKGKDFHMQMEVDLEDMYNGGEKAAQITRRVICRHCGKNGKKRHTEKCKACTTRCPNEVKMVQRQMAPGFVIQQQEEVPSTEKCKNEPKTLTAVIEKGMPHDEKITFERASEQKPGFIPGDVIMVIKQKKHRRFERRGNDLYHKITIPLKQALTGYQTTIPHLDKHVVEIDTEGSIVRYGEVRTFEGEGMPIHGTPSEYGNLHVEFIVDFPRRLNENQIDLLKKLLP
jgi:DnaJ-class molecular chaperone